MKWKDVHGSCLLCALVEEELRSETRIIAVGESFVALAPFSSRFPYQLWIIPRRHQRTPARNCAGRAPRNRPNDAVSEPELPEPSLQDSFNWSFLLGLTESTDYHWYIEAMPRITGQGGFELSTENYINIVTPESAASSMRADFTGLQQGERTE